MKYQARYELHASHQDSNGEPGGLMALTNSRKMAEKWQRKGGLVVDTERLAL